MKPRSIGLFFALVATLWLFSPSARAQAADEAKRHFTNGVHLFEDRNFAGALVEFEASFKQNPTAAALQNIAVCQKGLFRYADANATLERMLHDFGAQLSAEDKKAAEDAMREMSALIGTIVIKITPSDARVSINDSPLAPEAVKSPIKLAAGEYRIAAEAPGFARQEQRVNVTSGQKDGQVVITLIPLSGTVSIHAHDSQAAIALDGTQVGYDEWKGPASAGSARGVRLYVHPATQEHGGGLRRADHRGRREARSSGRDPRWAGGGPERPSGLRPPSQHGIYGFVVFGVDTMGSDAPHNLNQEKARPPEEPAVSLSGTVSRPVSPLSSTRTPRSTRSGLRRTIKNCSDANGSYHLTSARVGPAIRLMTNGRKGRFVGTIGVGAAVQSVAYDSVFGRFDNKIADESSVGSYLFLAGSYELNLGHFLLDAGVSLVGETGDEQKGIKSTGAFGLDFRIGYGQW